MKQTVAFKKRRSKFKHQGHGSCLAPRTESLKAVVPPLLCPLVFRSWLIISFKQKKNLQDILA